MNKDELKRYIVAEKMACVANTETGDLPPIVFAYKGEKVVAIVVAKDVDKIQGLNIARMLNAGMELDRITIAFDARLKRFTEVENPEEIMKNYKGGEFQRIAKSGSPEAATIEECILINTIDRGDKITSEMWPYSYGGKHQKFEWKEIDQQFTNIIEAGVVDGFIPQALRKIMADDKIIESSLYKQFDKMFKDFFKFSEDRQRFHIGRAALKIIKDMGYSVTDKWSDSFPEGKNWLPEEEYTI